MTPLEINKKITEIKLLKDEKFIPRNWAKNISDAWELFVEMPNPKLQLFNRDDAGMVRFPWRCQIDFNKDMEFLGSTAPIAISKAWLAWKENEK